MTTIAPRDSAEIIQFPVRGRFAADRTNASTSTRFDQVTMGTGWYHDDAIREAELASGRKN